MVLNHKIYFDLFPATLIPNSILKSEDIVSFGEKGYSIDEKKKYNSFFSYLKEMKLDCDSFSKMKYIGKRGNIFFYQSIKKYLPYSTKRGKKRDLKEEYIYLIYYKK